MTPALGQISIYKPTYYMRSGSIVRTRYINSEDTSGDFPVTDSCERSATVMNEDYVKLSFKLLGRVVFDAFAYIWYDNQLFFLKETYRPTAKGAYYQYDMKFVSIANMFDKHLCFRYLSVPGEDVSPEPEINMNGTLDDMAAIVIDSIHGAASRLNVSQANLFYVYVLQHLTLADDTQPNTTLETFSFSGQYIPDVLTQIASKYEIEWWVSQESMTSVQLHLCKCERGDTVVLSDRYRETGDSSHPYASKGLVAPCEYAQEWSNIPQKIIPFGSDRNITRKQALQSVNGNDMYVSYGKQLRLAPNHTYTVKDREGNSVQATTDALGAFTNTAVRSGIETTKQFDNIYPRCHFRVLSVKKEGTEHPIYTITAAAIKADGESLMSYDEMVAAGLLPLQIEPNETLSIIFESGYLNGREFEVAYDIKEVENVVQWTLKIVPEEGGDDGVQLPFGNFVPREKSSTYEGDMFAIFHMVMPQYYIERAQDELAQAAYDELLAIEDTRPEVKCKTEPEFFANQTICLGQRVAVHSELFGEIVENAAGEIEPDSPSLFVSRVTSFTHSLTKPNNVEFKLASSRVEGRLAEIEATIADRTSDIRGLEQRSLNLSRRGWHDASEMVNMLQTLAAAMMLVGVEKNQFAFTMAIECVGTTVVSDVTHFTRLHISAGYIQHTQEPYIKYANGGKWEVNAVDLTTDINGNSILYDPSDASEPWKTPYYLYAHCVQNATTADMCLSATSLENDPDYLLLGILSSEFLDDQASPVTSLRVFNRSNGYTQVTGGTITTEQIQDPTRSLIIDFASNPPRIIARDDAQIVGNISFYAADGTVQSAEQFVENKLGGIGGENLIETIGELYQSTGNHSGYNYSNIPFRNIQQGSYPYYPAGKYVFSARSITIYKSNGIPPSGVSLRIVDSTSRSANTIAELSMDNPKCKFELSSGAPLFLRVTWSESVSATLTIKGANLQSGEIATAYSPYVEHLTAALRGTTEVIGGLVMTNVLMLKDENGNVTAGISGLTGTLLNPEKVLLFGGGTYAEAVNAALNDYHKSGNSGALITTLLKKDGTGKIGVFKIGEDKVEVDVPGLGKVVIDVDDGITLDDSVGDRRIIVTPKDSNLISIPQLLRTQINWGASTEYEDVTSKTFEIASFEVQSNVNVFHLERGDGTTDVVWFRPDARHSDHRATSSPRTMTCRVYLKNGDREITIASGSCQSQQTYDSYHNVIYGDNFNFNLLANTTTFTDLKKGTWHVMTDVTITKVSIDTNNPVRFTVALSNIANYYMSYYDGAPLTAICSDGLISAFDKDNLFKIINGSTGQEVIIVGLPTSPNGLATGQMYNDGGTLKIKT